MFAAFEERRAEHELRWYVREALLDTPVSARLGAITTWVREEVNPLLLEASAHARRGLDGPDLRGADLLRKDLRRHRLIGSSLRGAALLGADLRGVDLRAADLTGADLRGADLSSADLSEALFLIQSQLQSARGDRATSVPRTRTCPSHWQ